MLRPWVTVPLIVAFAGGCFLSEEPDNPLDPFYGSGLANGLILLASVAGGITPSHTTLTEGDTTSPSVHRIQLSQAPTAPVAVTVSSADGRLYMNSAGTTSTQLTFTPDNYLSSQSVLVYATDNGFDETDSIQTQLQHSASSSDAAYAGLNLGTTTYTVLDDDVRGVTFSSTSGTTTEQGGQATFQVRLGAQPTNSASVTVSFATSDALKGTVSPTTMTFTQSNWNTNQSLTVTGQNEAPNFTGASASAYSIVTTITSAGGSDYEGLNPSDLSMGNLLRQSYRFFGLDPVQGNFGSVAAADALCVAQAPAATPALRSPKAMLVDGTNRRACTTAFCSGGTAEHINWVLKADADYYMPDGVTRAFTTTANGVATFNLNSNPHSGDTRDGWYWTGLTADWRTSAELCSAWTSTAGNGAQGQSGFSDSDSIASGGRSGTDRACSHSNVMLCVESP